MDIPLLEALVADFFRGAEQGGGRGKLGADSINFFRFGRHQCAVASEGGLRAPMPTCAPRAAWCGCDAGSTILTSDIAIIGRYRIKRRKSERKMPNVPAKVPISTQVGWYICQEEGRKSVASEVTIMTKRSNHIPAFT